MTAVAAASLTREDPWVPPSTAPEPMDLSTSAPGILPGGFTVGSYVLVERQYNPGLLASEGGLGYINDIDSGETVSVYYPVGKYTEKGVLLIRLHHAIGAPAQLHDPLAVGRRWAAQGGGARQVPAGGV